MRIRNSGFTLIELMISITLGIIIIFGIGQIFVATRTSYSAQQGLSHVQQAGRFATQFIASAVRLSGDMAFNNSSSLMQGEAATATQPSSATVSKLYQITNANAAGPEVAKAIDFAIPLQVYEWLGSAPGETVDINFPPNVGSGPDSWKPALPTFVADVAVDGSDVIIARYVESRTFEFDLKSAGATAIGGFSVENVCTANGLVVGTAEIPAVTTDDAYEDLVAAKPKRLIAIGQHDMVTIAQATIFATDPVQFRTWGAVGFPGNYTDAARRCGPLGQTPPARLARVGMARVDIFYIGRNAVTDEAGLWRMSFDGSDGTGFTAEELVEGIENMQVLAGVTLPTATSRASNRPDRYVTGSDLQVPSNLNLATENVPAVSRRTLSLRVALLGTSEEGAAGQLNELTYQLNRTTVNPPDDRRIRQVYETTLAVRNRQRMLSGARDTF